MTKFKPGDVLKYIGRKGLERMEYHIKDINFNSYVVDSIDTSDKSISHVKWDIYLTDSYYMYYIIINNKKNHLPEWW